VCILSASSRNIACSHLDRRDPSVEVEELPNTLSELGDLRLNNRTVLLGSEELEGASWSEGEVKAGIGVPPKSEGHRCEDNVRDEQGFVIPQRNEASPLEGERD
jgi:hypothetical protein